MQRAYKFRLYPSKEEEEILEQQLQICRILYNDCLTERRDAWKTSYKSINYYDQANQLKEIKEFDDDLKKVHSQVLQDVLKRVDRAFQNFFRRVKEKKGKAGFPRYKGKNRYDSFTYPQSGFVLEKEKGRLKLSKIGSIKIKLHRVIKGEVKTCTIRKDADQWYACFTVETPNEVKEKKDIRNAVGVDVGVKDMATLSNGIKIKNPKWLKRVRRN